MHLLTFGGSRLYLWSLLLHKALKLITQVHPGFGLAHTLKAKADFKLTFPPGLQVLLRFYTQGIS